MTSPHEIRRSQNTLRLAGGLLNWAAFVQLPSLLTLAAMQAALAFRFQPPWELPGKLHGFVGCVAGLLGLAGFIMVRRMQPLWDGEQDDEGVLERLPVRGVSVAVTVACVHVFFYCSFFIPLFNLLPILWARLQAARGVRELEAMLSETLTKQKQKARLQSGVADAFRTSP